MNAERMVVGFSILILVFTIAQVGTAVVSTANKPAPEVVAPRKLDAKGLVKKLETLDERLREAQASIDQVLVKLSNVTDETLREATRVRLTVLYRLEDGLNVDIERTRDELARVGGSR
jgi:hypothetical protein